MAENGEDKLIAVARHIAQTLGHTDNAMADDILQIFSNFDNRFREKLTENVSNKPRQLDQTVKTLDRRISRYFTGDEPIWSDAADAAAFLDAVDDLIGVVGDQTVSVSLDRAEDLLQQCMFRLEEEFKMLLTRAAFDLSGDGGGGYLDSGSDDDVFDDDLEVPVEVIK